MAEPVAPSARQDPPSDITILDLLVIVARRRGLLILLLILGGAAGFVAARFVTPSYEAQARLVRESQGEAPPANLGGLRAFGINLGGDQQGLSPEAYPDILKSREVLFDLVRDTFRLADGETVRLADYLIRDLDVDTSPVVAAATALDPEHVMVFTAEEAAAMGQLQAMISTSTNAESGLMTVKVAAPDPLLTAEIVFRAVELLAERVRLIVSTKSAENLEFIRQRFAEARAEQRAAAARLATFDDRNTNITLARLRSQRDQLAQELAQKNQLFTDLQGQLTQAEIEHQRSIPVITMIQRPAVPLKPTGLGLIPRVFLSALLGLFLGIVIAFALHALDPSQATESEREKVLELRHALNPVSFLRRRKRDRGPSAEEPEDDPYEDPVA